MGSSLLKDVLTSRSFLIRDNKTPFILNIASLIVLVGYILVNQNFLNESKIYGLEFPIVFFIIFMLLYLITKGLALFKLKKIYFVYAREALKNGKWAFLQSISRYFRTQSYVLAALFFLGVYEIGFINSSPYLCVTNNCFIFSFISVFLAKDKC